MRILFLNHNVARRGGTFYRAFDIARYLVRRGHEITLLTISADRRWGFEVEESEGVTIVHTPDLLCSLARTGWDPWDVVNRIAYLRGKQWDIIHAWDCRPVVILPALYARYQSRSSGGKLVIDWCDWWGRGGTQAERPGRWLKLLYGPVETYFEEAFRTRADATTVISQALYQRALSLGVKPETIHILLQGCEVKATANGDRATARRQLGVSASQPLLLSVGALTTSEANLLFATLRELFDRLPNCRFVMIGKHGAQIPADIKSAPQFFETGFISDTIFQLYISACDALLIPLADSLASQARWPSKVNPFLTAGRAVVITRVGDLAHLLERESAAVMTDCQPKEIAERVMTLINDPALQVQCERQALRVSRDLLAWPLLVGQLEKLYRLIRG